jgi:hypothetical protein
MRFTILLCSLLVACGMPAPDSDSGTDAGGAQDAAVDSSTTTDAADTGSPDVTGADVTDATPADAHRNCVDADGDGYGTGPECLGSDCNDADPAIHPGAMERCDGVDSNCDGSADTAGTALDAYCQGTCNGEPCTYTLPPVCFYPGRTDPNYTHTSLAHCQACRRDSTGTGYSCTCWLDGSAETWACGSRP